MSADRTQQVGQGPGAVHYCAWHPEIETGLSCSHCGKSICTQCMVQAPVGIRCRDCGKPVANPTYEVRPLYYLRGMTTAFMMGIGGGVLWGVYNYLIRYLFDGRAPDLLLALAAIVIGLASGEIVSRTVNRKRSILLSWAAGASVIISYAIAVLLGPFFSIYTLFALAVGVYIAMLKLR